MREQPGQLVLLGSGETSPSGRRVFDWIFQRLPSPIKLAILETPAGFQPNSALVAGKVAEFVSEHLTNYTLETTIVPARRRETSASPDDPALADLVLGADCIFLGPGSPTYAVRQLRESLVWDAARVRFANGATLILASAAVLALSAYTLPVYEIYKAGADLGWERGLDLLGPAGPTVVFVPHWNNREGGAELDTSHCFVGSDRFAQLQRLLPAPATIIGIDEHTAFVVEPSTESALVIGPGGVTIVGPGDTSYFGNGSRVPLGQLGKLDWSAFGRSLPPALLERAETTRPPALLNGPSDAVIPMEVLELVERRENARRQRDWKAADAIRADLAGRGFEVRDTPEGPRVSRLGDRSDAVAKPS
ncbi:MAG: CysS/YqeB C-terminal domain-containing protein [Chloroflexota bacterium]